MEYEQQELFICSIDNCINESTKLWAGTESGIVDVCDEHYEKLTKEKQ